MLPRKLVIENPGEAYAPGAYVCAKTGCFRCYNEAAGYFDFVAGRPILDTTQMLCDSDAHAMFLDTVSPVGSRLWKCPRC